jgi:glycosyltransferase involved in cell wall biosynthesis
LPVLEAMACGIPVLAANATSLPEIVGDAALLLPANDIVSWAEALVLIVGSIETRQILSERGSNRASQFSWDDTARQTIAVYRKLLGVCES